MAVLLNSFKICPSQKKLRQYIWKMRMQWSYQKLLQHEADKGLVGKLESLPSFSSIQQAQWHFKAKSFWITLSFLK